MRSASDIDWLGRHGRTIAEERRPESRTQTGRRTLVKGRREFTQVLFGVFVPPDRGQNRAFLNVLEAQLGPPAPDQRLLLKKRYLTRAAAAKSSTIMTSKPTGPMPHIIPPPIV